MRLEASKVLAKARLGTDTAADKRTEAAKIIVTLGQLVPRHLDKHQISWRPRYQPEIKRQLEWDWKPLHSLGMETITRQVILGVLDGIASEQARLLQIEPARH